MTGEQKPGGLERYGFRVFNAGIGMCRLVASPGLDDTNPEPLTPAEPAEARIRSLEAKLARAVEGLERIGIYGCGMLNQPAAMNGPNEQWLERRLAEYEREARQTLAALQQEGE